MTPAGHKKITSQLLGVFCLGLLLRLVLAVVIPSAGDIDAWKHYSTYWEKSLFSPYDEVCRYKYSPLWFWVITLVSFICKETGLNFSIAIRMPIIATDCFLFWLLLKSCQKLRFNSKQTLITLTSFFLNPVSVQISGYYGQFDNMSLLFVLLAWYAWSFYSSHRFWWALVFLNLSLAVKHFTIMLVPVFAFVQKNWFRKIALGIAAPILFLIILMPYWVRDTHWVNVNVFQYKLGSGYWGWLGVICRSTLLFTGFDMIRQPWFKYASIINPLLYVGIIMASFYIVKRYSLLDSLVLILLIFYSLTTEIAPQYTIWIIPFAVFRPNRYLFAYSAIAGVQLAFFYYSHYHWFYQYSLPRFYSETFVIFRYLTWVVCVFWLFHMLRLKKRKPSV